MPTGIIGAIQVANGIVSLISSLAAALSEVHATIGKANSENRDLTDDEMVSVTAARHLAEQATLAMLAAKG